MCKEGGQGGVQRSVSISFAVTKDDVTTILTFTQVLMMRKEGRRMVKMFQYLGVCLLEVNHTEIFLPVICLTFIQFVLSPCLAS